VDARIFVQIAAYRDRELLPTLADCLARAADPSRLRFGIYWQRDESESLGDYVDDARFRIIDVDYRRARGPCWARHRIQGLYQGESYTLHLDSHHRFVDGWDDLCVQMLCDLQRAGVSKPILTSYAPIYDPERDPEGRVPVPFRIKFHKFAANGLVEVLPAAMNEHGERDTPIPARFFSAHFAFTLGSFCTEVRYDPKLYFFGEEPTLAVRAFTHGYDLFHPHKLILWHYYGRNEVPKHWSDDSLWYFHDQRSQQRARQLLGIDETSCELDFGPYGLGTVRSLRDYQVFAGIHYGMRGVSDHTLRDEPPPEPGASADDPRWSERFVRRHSVRIRVLPNDLPRALDDLDFLYVGAHSEDDQEIYRCDLAGAELASFLCRQPHEWELAFDSPLFPRSWTVWPHSRGRGWLRKVTGEIR